MRDRVRGPVGGAHVFGSLAPLAAIATSLSAIAAPPAATAISSTGTPRSAGRSSPYATPTPSPFA